MWTTTAAARFSASSYRPSTNRRLQCRRPAQGGRHQTVQEEETLTSTSVEAMDMSAGASVEQSNCRGRERRHLGVRMQIMLTSIGTEASCECPSRVGPFRASSADSTICRERERRRGNGECRRSEDGKCSPQPPPRPPGSGYSPPLQWPCLQQTAEGPAERRGVGVTAGARRTGNAHLYLRR